MTFQTYAKYESQINIAFLEENNINSMDELTLPSWEFVNHIE